MGGMSFDLTMAVSALAILYSVSMSVWDAVEDRRDAKRGPR